MSDQEKEKKAGIPYVTLVEDPFGIRTNDIAREQSQEGELNLHDDALDWTPEESTIDMTALRSGLEQAEAQPEAEADLAEPAELDFAEALQGSEMQLQKLAQVIEEENARQIEEYEKSQDAAIAAAELAEQLAKEIADDQALALELAKQAEAEEAMEAVDPELQAALPQSLDVAEMESCLETLLFLSDKPVSVERLRAMIGEDFPLPLYQEAVTNLKDRYKAMHHGIELAEIAGALQFRTKPGRAALAKKLAKVQTQKLSGGAMETLAIVAYRQPILKEEIDKIRGVDSSYFVRGLLDRKLIQISGRSELPGRPMLYTTTQEFLEVFGLKDLAAMPSLREIESMVPTSQSANPEDEDPRVKEMRRLVGQMKSDTSTSLIYDHREDEKILKEIRERVNSIPTSTPYLDEQKAQEKAAKEAALLAAQAANQAQPQPELPMSPETGAPTEGFVPPPAPETQGQGDNPST